VEDLDIGGRIILISMLRNYNGREFILCFSVGITEDRFEVGRETPSSMKCWKFIYGVG